MSVHPKVNFIIIGAQKAGTSALNYYLKQHPQIGVADKKELHFFNDEILFSASEIDYSAFEGQFDFSSLKKVYGEATPVYIYWEPCIRRIWEYNKDIKLIIILRDPTDRTFSHWNMEVYKGSEKEDFMYCVQNENVRMKEALPLQHRDQSYVDRGFYSEQIRRILRFFKKEQLLFIKYEEFFKNQEQILKQVFDFLDVTTENYHFKRRQVHKKPYVRKITKEERECLIDLFINDINEVERMLQWDCSDWKRTAE